MFTNFSVLEEPPPETTSIISATSSEPFYAQWNLANSHDGGLETYIDYCFHSKAQTNGWAEYQIDTAAVRSVGVLNRESVTSGEFSNTVALFCEPRQWYLDKSEFDKLPKNCIANSKKLKSFFKLFSSCDSRKTI